MAVELAAQGLGRAGLLDNPEIIQHQPVQGSAQRGAEVDATWNGTIFGELCGS